MKTVLWIAGSLLLIGIAVSVAPDVRRYMKISSM
jgi:hypothetical protein